MRILQHLHFTGKNQAHCPVRSGRRILIGMLATIFILSSCRRQALPHITLEDDFRLPVTSVRNQQQWPTGWIYATLALVETERILVGDSLDLSPDYLVRQLAGQLGNGRLGNPGRALTATDFQGSPARCIQLMERYGVILNGIYRDSLSTSCHQFCNIVNHLPAGNAGRQALQVVLDTTFDYLPSYVSLYGVVYTPHELLRSVVEEGSYQQLSIAEIHRNFGTPSHLIDRTLNGFVVDFLYFSLIDFPVFNVADIYVTVSAFLLMYLFFFFYQENELSFIVFPGLRAGSEKERK